MINLRRFLLENEAVEGVRSPFDYLYVKVLRFPLILINSWPSKELGENQSSFISSTKSIFLSVLVFIHFVGGILYIALQGKYLTFLEIGYAYITTFMNFVLVSRLITITLSTKYRNVAKLFFTEIHLFYHKNISEFAMKIHKRVHTISHFFCLWLTMQTSIGVMVFNLNPMYNYFSTVYNKNLDITGPKNLTFDISAYILYPFYTYSSTTGYLVYCIFNWISSTLAAIWFCMLDLFLALMVFHLWGHFNILLHKLNNFPKPACRTYEIITNCEKYSQEELRTISKLLKDCIDYHRLIVSFTKKMSDAFGAMMFFFYAFHQVSGCLLLLECSQMTAAALTRFLPITIILNQQLIQLSVIMELIGSTSEKLNDSVYGLPWELMDVKNRKTALIFLMNVQKPIHVKALGIADVGVTSMAMILKTSFSYFTFLRSM